MIRRKKRKHCVREGQPLLALDGGEPGVGAGFRARCGGVRTGDPGAERGGCVHAGVFGVGSGHELRHKNIPTVLVHRRVLPAMDGSSVCSHRTRSL